MPIEYNYQGHVGRNPVATRINVPSRINIILRGSELFRKDLEKALEGHFDAQLSNYRDQIRSIQAEATALVKTLDGTNPASTKQ